MTAAPRALRTCSKTKALAHRTQGRRRKYHSFRNETHSAVSFPTPEHCANPLPFGIWGNRDQKLSLIAPCSSPGWAAAERTLAVMHSHSFVAVTGDTVERALADIRIFAIKTRKHHCRATF